LRKTGIETEWLKHAVLCDTFGPDGVYYKREPSGCIVDDTAGQISSPPKSDKTEK
jgi:hypothetical protein